MKILVDTNVLFSAILFPNSVPSHVLKDISKKHTLFLTDQNISELKRIISKKIPEKLPYLEAFLAELSYILIHAVPTNEALLRDATDIPIINAAIIEGIDIIITGDKDFLDASIAQPKCIRPNSYMQDYMV